MEESITSVKPNLFQLNNNFIRYFKKYFISFPTNFSPYEKLTMNDLIKQYRQYKPYINNNNNDYNSNLFKNIIEFFNTSIKELNHIYLLNEERKRVKRNVLDTFENLKNDFSFLYETNMFKKPYDNHDIHKKIVKNLIKYEPPLLEWLVSSSPKNYKYNSDKINEFLKKKKYSKNNIQYI